MERSNVLGRVDGIGIKSNGKGHVVSVVGINGAMCRLSSLIKRAEFDTLKQHQCEFILMHFVDDGNILSDVIC